ncbi:unnamed protein product, partial [Candidula unifasciata]
MYIALSNKKHTLDMGSTAFCNKRAVAGPCSNYTRFYYYNTVNSMCQAFMYSGCGGNDNRFSTLRQCKSTCEHEGYARNEGAYWS